MGYVWVGIVWACSLIFVWLRDKIRVGKWCCKVVGSCEVRFLLSRDLIRTNHRTNSAELNRSTISSDERLVVGRDGQVTFYSEINGASAIKQRSVTHDVSVDLRQMVQCQLRQSKAVLQYQQTLVNLYVIAYSVLHNECYRR